MIAFLHTLSANVDKFDKLVTKHAPEAEVKHYVNKKLLQDALATGEADYIGFNAEIEEIKKDNPTLIICSCSSYGEACDRRSDVERIDQPIVEYMLRKYNTIGLAYAASSTRNTSADLILTTATALGKEVNIIDINCTDAWQSYLDNNHEEYASKIAEQIMKQSSEVDVVFLAQASMEGAKEYVNGDAIEILASPDYGVKSYLLEKDTSTTEA